ncbi:YopX family protein [Campylobacter coli]
MKLKDFDFRIWDNGKYHYPLKINNGIVETNFKIGLNDEIELFTGFYDKNGKKIYEGDILENEEFAELYLITRNDIVYNIIEIAIYRKNIKGQLYKYAKNADISFFKSIPSNKYMEIVGNINENKDLLKEQVMIDNIVKCPCCKQNIEIDQDILNDLQLLNEEDFCYECSNCNKELTLYPIFNVEFRVR